MCEMCKRKLKGDEENSGTCKPCYELLLELTISRDSLKTVGYHDYKGWE